MVIELIRQFEIANYGWRKVLTKVSQLIEFSVAALVGNFLLRCIESR